ncbi:MAG: ABC-type branched-chain amino acid transport system, ATPase component [Frankiales bacterium]|jgi:ABC-type branched-subunit amino acid transport system ATPase component/MFS family permease|nr:ABC-type branched-chain amino acid transport system, ATPase component [Frankiales bacterium]
MRLPGADRLRDYLEGRDPRPVAAMFGLNAVDELDNATFVWVAPTIAAAFGVGVGAFGVITVLVLLVAPLIAIPVSLYADRRARMPIVLLAACAWGLFSLGSGLAPYLWLFVLARVGSSFGRTVSYPVQLSLLADFYPPQVRTKALGLHALANNAGAIFGALLGAGVAELFGWRAAFFVVAVPTVLAIGWSRRVPEPPRGTFEAVQSATALPLREVAPKLWAIRSLRYQWIAGIYFVGAVIGTTIVLPFYFDAQFGVGTFGVGLIGAVAGVGAAVATFFGSKLAQDRLNLSASTGVLWLSRVTLAVTVLIVLFALSPSVWVAVPLLFVIVSLFGLVAPLIAAVGTLVSPPELRASAYAFGQVIGLVGALFAVTISLIADAAGERWALAFAAAVFLRGVFHIRTVGTLIDSDVDRLRSEHVGQERRTDADGRPLLLETQGLTVSYGPVRVLFGVDLEVRQGEIVALLGTNGAGKSTVLNAVSGLLSPDGGNVWFDGEPITGESAERVAARGLVQAPGGRGIFPGMTVQDNLRLGAFLLRGDKAVSAARIEAALDLFPALRPMLGRTAGDLSGGQRQMLVLAQAMLLKPRLLLIDELSLGLAPIVVQELLAAVRRLNAEGVTIVLVEQSVNVALTLADRAYFLEKGTVRFEGPTSDLLGRDDLLRSVFFGGATQHPVG